MVLNSHLLEKLPVFTRSGIHVGRVESFDLDADTGRISILHVNTKAPLPKMLTPELLISWSQIVSMDAEKIVIADAAVPEGAPALA